MTSPSLQASVAERIKALYAISRELEQLFPGKHYTPDGHMVGSIGEALAASWYGLELFTAGAETHDAKAPDGRLVQIKATQIDRVALFSEPEWLLVMKIHHDGIFIEEYNGPGALAWEHCGKMQKNGQRPISLAALKQSKSEPFPFDIPYFTTVCNGKISEQHLILFVNQIPTDLWFSP